MKRIHFSKLTLAVGAAVAMSAAGCNRTGLVARVEDGGVRIGPDARETPGPDLAPEPQAGPERGPEVGPDTREAGAEAKPETAPELGPELGPEARPEVAETGPDIRETGRESRPDIGPEVFPEVAPDLRPEAGSDVDPPVCIPLTSTITLADLAWSALPSSLAVMGDNIFVGIWKHVNDTSPPANAIVAVSIASKTSKTYQLGSNFPAWITAGDHALFYMQGKPSLVGGSAWSYAYSDIARLDLATGQVSLVDHEVLPYGYTILSLTSNVNGEVFWSMMVDANSGASVIKQWDRAAGSARTVMKVEQPASVLVDADHFYWSGLGSSGSMGFFSAPTTGGPVSPIFEWPSDPTDVWSLAAVDGQSIYYTHPNSPLGGIFAMPKQGGNTRTLVDVADPIALGSRTIDDTHVYWVDSSDQYNIRRVAKTGNGSIETVQTGGTSAISDFAVDGCNIYWTAASRNQLLARGK